MKELPFENTKRRIRVFAKERNGVSEKNVTVTMEVPNPLRLEMVGVSSGYFKIHLTGLYSLLSDPLFVNTLLYLNRFFTVSGPPTPFSAPPSRPGNP